ncbi:Uncharacterised protein [Legionella lansingensis]|nr:Uncharacterised protein [Legionella lansingensis]
MNDFHEVFQIGLVVRGTSKMDSRLRGNDTVK